MFEVGSVSIFAIAPFQRVYVSFVNIWGNRGVSFFGSVVPRTDKALLRN